MGYFGQQPEPIVAPKLPAPPTLFGPSYHKATSVDVGVLHNAVVWIGGMGLAIDARWGNFLSISFILQTGEDLMTMVNSLLDKNKADLVKAYGSDQTDLIIMSLHSAFAGVLLTEPMLPDDVKAKLA